MNMLIVVMCNHISVLKCLRRINELGGVGIRETDVPDRRQNN